jgi:hypothetical protein
MITKYLRILMTLIIAVNITSSFASTQNTNADSIIVLNESIFTFPLILPGDTIIVKKILNVTTGIESIISNSPLVNSIAALDSLQQKEKNAEQSQISTKLSDELKDTIAQKKDSDTIRIKIYLRTIPGISHTPVVEKSVFITSRNIVVATLTNPLEDSLYKLEPDLVITDVTKARLLSLCLDTAISQIEQYIEYGPVQNNIRTDIASTKVDCSNINKLTCFTLDGRIINIKKLGKNSKANRIVIFSTMYSSGRVNYQKRVVH